MKEWVTSELSSLGWIALSAIVVYSGIILYCRIAGLRSFSKMSAPDFAMTVAVGSLFASTISSPSPSIISGLFALALLFAGQWLIAFVRSRSEVATSALDNDPLLLMKDGEFLFTNLKRANVTESDVFAKLRETNAYRFDRVKAVIFESTGDISVIHGENGRSLDVDDAIFQDVNGWKES